MGFEIDDSAWPHVTYIFSDTITNETFQKFLDQAAHLLMRKEPHTMLMDLSAVVDAPPQQRSMAASFNAKHEVELRMYRVASAFVVKSPLVRGIMTAIFWLRTPPYPYKVVSKREDGVAYCKEMLAAASKRAS